jgi:calcineurin-like phosphoesterase family protein
MATHYFTSNLHLGHNNVIRFSDRPYFDVNEMNEALISNINKVVLPEDSLYILGDLSFKCSKGDASELIKKIACKNLYLINGNHDKDWSQTSLFKEVCDYKELKLEDGMKVALFHYPIMDWNGCGHHRGDDARKWSVHLHGHIHSKGNERNLQNFIKGIYRYDVGVDANNYEPVSIGEILALI